MERDKNLVFRFHKILYFNSHAHVERDHHVELTDGGKYNFNSHAHVERDQIDNAVSVPGGQFQLTRSRGA